jgi:hypothetical protein
MLIWYLRWPTSHISIWSLTQIVGELVELIPVLLERVGNLVGSHWVPQLQDRVVVKRPILSLLVFPPKLLAFDTEDLDSNTSRRSYVVGDQLRSERGVSHDHVVLSGLREHALGKVCREVVVDLDLADDTLGGYC